mgnify:CR=1 FL=1
MSPTTVSSLNQRAVSELLVHRIRIPLHQGFFDQILYIIFGILRRHFSGRGGDNGIRAPAGQSRKTSACPPTRRGRGRTQPNWLHRPHRNPDGPNGQRQVVKKVSVGSVLLSTHEVLPEYLAQEANSRTLFKSSLKQATSIGRAEELWHPLKPSAFPGGTYTRAPVAAVLSVRYSGP